jgi:hypothetical protein
MDIGFQCEGQKERDHKKHLDLTGSGWIPVEEYQT